MLPPLPVVFAHSRLSAATFQRRFFQHSPQQQLIILFGEFLHSRYFVPHLSNHTFRLSLHLTTTKRQKQDGGNRRIRYAQSNPINLRSLYRTKFESSQGQLLVLCSKQRRSYCLRHSLRYVHDLACLAVHVSSLSLFLLPSPSLFSNANFY